MPIPYDRQQQIIARIHERTGGIRPCSLCGTNDWELDDAFTQLPVHFRLHGSQSGGAVFPFVVIFCKKCGNTHLLNSIVLGIHEWVEDEDEDEEDPFGEVDIPPWQPDEAKRLPPRKRGGS